MHFHGNYIFTFGKQIPGYIESACHTVVVSGGDCIECNRTGRHIYPAHFGSVYIHNCAIVHISADYKIIL
jgi:hypothetical protein